MFDTLSDRLDGVFKKLRSRGKLHPKQVDNALAEVRCPSRWPTTCWLAFGRAPCPKR
jgi:hypothetical protein